MQDKRKHRQSVGAVVGSVLGLMILGSIAVTLLGIVGPAAAATQRPLADFINNQGSTSFYWPPFPDYFGWVNQDQLVSSTGKPLQCRFALIDYTGLGAAYLAAHGGPWVGTTVSGSVTERPLADGRAEVTVVLHTTNALTFAQTCDNIGPDNPDAFGYQQAELLANPALQPGLSEVDFQAVFKNTAPGAPLPDLVQQNVCSNFPLDCHPFPPGFEPVSMDIRANGSGPLHVSAGVPEGTPGRLEVTQTGIFRPQPGGRVIYDAYPAERVDWHPTGR